MNPSDESKKMRTAAEAQLARSQQTDTRSTEVLLHELQVHQVELKMQNEALRQAQSELEASRDRYVDLYDFAPVGYLTVDGNGMIEEANLTAVNLLATERMKLLQRRFISLIIAEDRSRWHTLFLRLMKQDDKGSVELALQRGDGTVFPALLDYQRTKVSADGPVIRIALTDITVRMREAQLNAAKNAAESANRAKSEFLSSMSHELRTPLNAILGFAQLLEFDTSLTDDHQVNVHEIVKAGQHLLTLINEVLDLGKIESGSLELSLAPVALQPMVDECLSLVSRLAQQRHIEIDAQGVRGGTVQADPIRLKQAVLNLLGNAIKYNRDSGRVTVETALGADNRFQLRISDTGPGVAKARHAELFQPFNRLGAESSAIEGTGIGLSITRRIIEMMDGTVGVQSEPGAGSTFWIELPQSVHTTAGNQDNEDNEDNADARAADPNTQAAGTDATAKQTVLYVEDNPANLRLVTKILQRVPGIHLLTAHTPELGIELALTHQPDLILLDIQLPGMDGYQVLTGLRAVQRLQHTPVLAISANAMPQDMARGKAAGFDDYLTKPLDTRLFLATVTRYLSP